MSRHTSRLCCLHCGTPLLRGYGHLVAGVINRRRDCPRCGARYDTREEIVSVNRRPVAERGVPALSVAEGPALQPELAR